MTRLVLRVPPWIRLCVLDGLRFRRLWIEWNQAQRWNHNNAGIKGETEGAQYNNAQAVSVPVSRQIDALQLKCWMQAA